MAEYEHPELAALRAQLAEANERAKSLQASKEVAESLLKDADMNGFGSGELSTTFTKPIFLYTRCPKT